MADSAVQEPFELKLGDGSVVKGANMEEALKSLAKMKEDTAAALKQAKEENERLSRQAEELRVASQRKPEPVVEGKFNNDHYYKLLNEDPLAAQDYLDAHRFGIPQEQVRNTFNSMRQDIDTFRQQSVAAAFTAKHAEDWPAGDASAAKNLRVRVQELVNQGFPFNPDTLDYAYGQLVSEGAIKPVEEKQDDTQPPNPALTGGGGVSADLDYRKAEQMSDKELEAELRKRGAL